MKYDIQDLQVIHRFLQETLAELAEHNTNESSHQAPIIAQEYIDALNSRLQKLISVYDDKLAKELGVD